MKPRTNLQFDVISRSHELHYKDGLILKWAKKDILQHKGFATKNRVVCMDCGEKFTPNLVSRKRAVCPHCGQKLVVEQSQKTTFEQKEYVGFAQVIGEYQVVRYFQIGSRHKAGRSAESWCYEILQQWILESGKYETVARMHTLNWSVDSWNGELEIRKDNRRRYYGGSEKYLIYTESYHPESVFKPIYSKYGINNKLAGMSVLEAIKMIPESTQRETLLKARQYHLLSYSKHRLSPIERLWPSIRICLRNKYIIKAADIWIDYIDSLVYFGKDIRNAHYVCPKNLKKEHDRWMDKKRKCETRKNAIRENKEYIKEKGSFLGIEFGDKQINIKALKTVQEFIEEGDELHHCVFTGKYYNRADSLILSARKGEKRIETIEVSLSDFKVRQSRGLLNKNSKYHDQIVDLVNRNMSKIQQLAMQQ